VSGKYTNNWTQNKADMIARILRGFVVPVMYGEDIVAIGVGETEEIAKQRADEIIRCAAVNNDDHSTDTASG
jgi:hypothetical protein